MDVVKEALAVFVLIWLGIIVVGVGLFPLWVVWMVEG